jgi:hypothetical protein
MNNRRFLSLILVFFIFSISAIAQELNFKVKTQFAPNIRLFSEKAFIENVVGKSIEDLFNNTKWGEDSYKEHEKIKGTVTLNIKSEALQGNFEAELLIQIQRPVFNSSYETNILSIGDQYVKFVFTETQQVLNKTNNTFTDNLSAIISFYAYLALGLDADTFKVNGGDNYFKKAQEIILSLPAGVSGDSGWTGNKSYGTNRFWALENMQNPVFRQYRQSIYEYHRLGLDKMYDDPDKSRAVILSALTSIGQANLEYPNSYAIELFCNTKNLEIIEIFKIADKGQKDKVKSIMSGMDVQRKQMYDKI